MQDFEVESKEKGLFPLNLTSKKQNKSEIQLYHQKE